MGAGVLPATIHNDKLMFLFGKERDTDENPGWSDFGGGSDDSETFIETAAREGSEELTGFLGTASDINKYMSNGTYNIKYTSTLKSGKQSFYKEHIFPLSYSSELVRYYNNNQRFIQKHLAPSIINEVKIFEKPEIRWVYASELRAMRPEFRTFYRNIVDKIIKELPAITKFIRKSINKSKSNNSKSNNSKSNNSKSNKLTKLKKTTNLKHRKTIKCKYQKQRKTKKHRKS